MIARLDHLRKHPAVFRHLTGLTVAVFDELAAAVVLGGGAEHGHRVPDPGECLGHTEPANWTKTNNTSVTTGSATTKGGSESDARAEAHGTARGR